MDNLNVYAEFYTGQKPCVDANIGYYDSPTALAVGESDELLCGFLRL
jgi:hypothetical protein